MSMNEEYLNELKEGNVDLTYEPDNGEFINTGTDEMGLIQFEDGSGLLYWAGDEPYPYWQKPLILDEEVEKFKREEMSLYELKRV